MKTKIVLWGTNEKDEKLLIAIELVAKDNKIKIYTFPENVATEVFYNQMMNLWRNNQSVVFPENHETIEKELSITENILPETIRVDRTDLINRAKTEWHFVVLSSKLHQSYKTEIEDFKERIEQLTNFESGIWEEMKSFWNKVQTQSREKNLFREHADELRSHTNDLFNTLKAMKKSLDKEFEKVSKEKAGEFFDILKKIEERIEKGLGLQPIFNELKNIQSNLKDTDLTRSDRSKVWKRIDTAFKQVKEKKFGSAGPAKTALERVNRRYEGLESAIQKMQSSIDRDKKEMGFQNKRIETTDGQLEQQIRQAKIKMVEERIRSKEEKLNEMLKTKAELLGKIESEKKREEERKIKTEIKKEESKVKEKIAKDIEEKKEEIGDKAPELEKAAAEISESKKPRKANKKTDDSKAADVAKAAGAIAAGTTVASSQESIIDAISTTITEAVENVVDTVKAVAEVVEDKIEEVTEAISEDIKEAVSEDAPTTASSEEE